MGGVEDFPPPAEEEAARRFQANSGVTAAWDEDDAMFTQQLLYCLIKL